MAKKYFISLLWTKGEAVYIYLKIYYFVNTLFKKFDNENCSRDSLQPALQKFSNSLSPVYEDKSVKGKLGPWYLYKMVTQK